MTALLGDPKCPVQQMYGHLRGDVRRLRDLTIELDMLLASLDDDGAAVAVSGPLASVVSDVRGRLEGAIGVVVDCGPGGAAW